MECLLFSPNVCRLVDDTSGLGAKSQNLSSVAHPRKKKLVTIFSQGHVWGLRNPCFTKFSVVNYL